MGLEDNKGTFRALECVTPPARGVPGASLPRKEVRC